MILCVTVILCVWLLFLWWLLHSTVKVERVAQDGTSMHQASSSTALNEGEGGRVMDTLELLQCSQINFDNLVKMNPQIKGHPMYMIARTQLDEAIKQFEAELEAKP